MRRFLAIIVALLIGVILGVLSQRSAHRSMIEGTRRYFDVRSTATELDGRLAGPFYRCGSQELAFIEGKSIVRIYHVVKGKKEPLREFIVYPEWFRSLWFTTFQEENGDIGIVMSSQSLLVRASDPIPAEYVNERNLFAWHWEYNLGKIASVWPTCNEAVTRNPLWKPGIETPALSYQFSRNKKDFRPLAMKGNMMFSRMSEQAMIEASANEADVEFVLVTVEVRAD